MKLDQQRKNNRTKNGQGVVVCLHHFSLALRSLKPSNRGEKEPEDVVRATTPSFSFVGNLTSKTLVISFQFLPSALNQADNLSPFLARRSHVCSGPLRRELLVPSLVSFNNMREASRSSRFPCPPTTRSRSA